MKTSLGDIVSFAAVLLLAGVLPVVLVPGLDVAALLATVQATAGSLPLEHVGFVLIVAVAGAAWLDTGGSPPSRVDTDLEPRD